MQRKKIEQRRQRKQLRTGHDHGQFVAHAIDQRLQIGLAVMFTQIAIADKQHGLGNPHPLDHRQKTNVGLAHPGSAADDINDQMGFEQVVLNHGQVKRVRRITALAIGHLDVTGQHIADDIELDVL